jgi:hypothetical protein
LKIVSPLPPMTTYLPSLHAYEFDGAMPGKD